MPLSTAVFLARCCLLACASTGQAKFQLGVDTHARIWYPTPLTKLQHVQSLTLFFPSAIGGDDVSTKLRCVCMQARLFVAARLRKSEHMR